MDSVTITLPDDSTTALKCHHCGFQFLQRIRELKHDPSISCHNANCGKSIPTNSKEVRISLEAREKELVKLLRAFKLLK